ncbi:hypothetical protein PAT3040_03024 [Paenibacillus agaridevorans]|uniref:WD40 repeat domain-containing protein n=1 Tax=Paenibacillus agaridevorans TaxID=171404 RepID=A0A2R5EP49_9BACL|nr:hypothetical protein [Paenibacillus agaridevorans]GBG08442.1 hypothetical protein PAT3040_03024 [Paenibacillus agaridevorans]
MKPNLLAEIPPEHTKWTPLPKERGHDSVWDFVQSPDGRFYISVCGETLKPLTAMLYEYDPRTGEVRLVLDLEKEWIVDAKHMPPSKIHTSIDFLPDGRLIMATHNTSPAPGHDRWMFEQHYEHPWEGYPGSIVMIVNPDNGEVHTRGIPVPKESIYGGILGEDPRYYYFLGYMRGHFYRLDLETNEVRDYGKVTEYASCRLVKDRQGRIYGSSYTGEIWRYDPATDVIQDLKVCFVSPYGNKVRRALIYGLLSPTGTLFLCDNTDGEMIELNPESLEVKRHGYVHLRPEYPRHPELAASIGGLAADENFVLYYGLESFHDTNAMRLVRWDILNGKEPENLGLISPEGRTSSYICEMLFDDRGILHMVDVCGQFSPYVLAVEVSKLTPPDESAKPARITKYVPPEFHSSNDPHYYMHISAKRVSTLPLHRYLSWGDTKTRYLEATEHRIYSINGSNRTIMIEADYCSERPLDVVVIHEEGSPVSCHRWGSKVAILTSDRQLLTVRLCDKQLVSIDRLPDKAPVDRIVGELSEHELLVSDCTGQIFILHNREKSCRSVEGLVLASPEAHVIHLGSGQFLLSGTNDEIYMWDLLKGTSEKLPAIVPSIRGRAFKAAITGGTQLENGNILAGTADGILFLLDERFNWTRSYGRLYSSGSLREFIYAGQGQVLGVYGDEKDVGHVFRFSEQEGLADLGRARVIRENAEQLHLDTEWANIHVIGALAYWAADDRLVVASAEQYGCMVRYQSIAGGTKSG